MDTLPFRAFGRLARVLGMDAGELQIRAPEPERQPAVRCVLPHPVSRRGAFVLRVHSQAGIPLASAAIEMNAGDVHFETPWLTFLGMEGYGHLSPAKRLEVERRVWARRAFATGNWIGR